MRIDGTAGSFPLNDSLHESLLGEPREYRKTGTVLAAELREDVEVKTPEGVMKAKAGDYLAQAPDGHAWPVMRSYFEDNNEPVDDAAAGSSTAGG